MKRRSFIGASAATFAANTLFAGSSQSVSAVILDDLSPALHKLNAARLIAGVAPVKVNHLLQIVARDQCLHIRNMSETTHFDAVGRMPDQRAAAKGYNADIPGETLAKSHDTLLGTIDTWLNTANTRDVILDPSAREIGLGKATGLDDQIWLAAIFGSAA